MTQNTTYSVRNSANGDVRVIEINGGSDGRGFIQNKDFAMSAIYALKDLLIERYRWIESGFIMVSDVEIGTGVGYVHASYKGDTVKAPYKGWMPVDRLGDNFNIGSWGNTVDPEIADIKTKTENKCTFINAYEMGMAFTIDCGPKVKNVAADAIAKIEAGVDIGLEMTNLSIHSKVENDRVWRKGKGRNKEYKTKKRSGRKRKLHRKKKEGQRRV